MADSNSSQDGSHYLNRRKFLGLMGASAAVLLANPAWGAFDLPPDEMERWERTLFDPNFPRLYVSSRHTDARMHLGGIGTGNFEIGADGQLTTWQLFNTLRDGQIPFYFGVKVGKTSKLLQTAGGPDWPRIKQIEMTGEYPFAALRFKDDELPVKVELEAFSPLAPLDSEFSSMPLVIFKFRLRNPTDQPQTVSLATMFVNPVGYAAIGDIQNCSHPSFGSNLNEPFRTGQATGLFLRAESGSEPTLDKLVFIYLLNDLFSVPPDPNVGDKNHACVTPEAIAIPPLDRPKNLKVETITSDQFFKEKPTYLKQSVIWLEDAPVSLSETLLSEIKTAVEAGATLVFSGSIMPLLNIYATATNGLPIAEAAAQPDIIFEDFERGYDKWTVTGEAFGREPAHGAFPGQQPVSGFLGKGLVNSFVGGDDTTGKLTSRTFTIERNFICFLVGGGHYPATQIRLIINGKIVRATSGEDSEQLKPAVWSVRGFIGQTAHLEIVDDQKGGWGHINVDQIVFSDLPGSRALLELLDSLLPIRFSAVQPSGEQATEYRRVTFEKQILRAGSKFDSNQNGLKQFVRPVGQGRVILLDGQLLNPDQTYSARVRQRTYSTLCSLVGANYAVTIGQSDKEPGYGTLALAVLGGNVTGLTHFEDWSKIWNEFSECGQFVPCESLKENAPTPAGKTANGVLAATVSVPPGGTVEVPFLLVWHYPNKYSEDGDWMGCYYTTKWPNARTVMRDAVANYDKLDKKTHLFRKIFYDSTLPYWLLDGITANAAIARHIGVVFRIANGDIYGWEGSNGSCPPTCTHVWGYEQSFAHLFPDLEKEMRRIDFFHQQNADGGINNRTDVPSPPHPTGEQPATDGHASCILKAYREALNSTDDVFFKNYWPRVKRAVEYLIQRDAKLSNGQPIGILQDEQGNTYDEALHGVTTFISGYYLAALRAGEEWARRMNDLATAERYHCIFESGQKKLIELCWNDEYFQQHLPDYLKRGGEVGPGCMSDQLIGQWWAHQLDLGYLFPKEMVISALRSIFKYNWKSDLTGWKHQPRAFAGAHDKGLIICTWPKGGRPENVMLYSDEVWTGIEYQVAAHMIYEGMIEEGFCVAKGARDRYDGIPRPPIGRNPWCEIECGGHYARAMSSWSLLLALSGFHYDGPRAVLRFAPSCKPEDFKCFFSAAAGWGSFCQNDDGETQKVEIAVNAGTLQVKTLKMEAISNKNVSNLAAVLAGKKLSVEVTPLERGLGIHFGAAGITIEAGAKLEITMTS